MHFIMHLNLSTNGENFPLLRIICKALQQGEKTIVNWPEVSWLNLYTACLLVTQKLILQVY